MKTFQRLCIASTIILAVMGGWYVTQGVRAWQQPADIRFVVTSWPAAQLLYAARSRGFFDRAGVTVEIIDVRSDERKAVEAVRSGEVDGGIFLLSQPLLLATDQVPLEVVADLDYSAGADGIVVSDAIHSFQDLRGRRLAIATTGLGRVLLREALIAGNLQDGDIDVVSATPLIATRMFLNGEVDAVVATEPYLSVAAERPNATILLSSRERPGLIADVFAFRTDVVRQHPEEVAKFLRGWFAFVDEFERGGTAQVESYATVALSSGLRMEQVKEEFEGIQLLNFAANAVAFTYSTDITSLYGSVERLAQFLVTEGQLETPKNPASVLNPTFIRRGLR